MEKEYERLKNEIEELTKKYKKQLKEMKKELTIIRKTIRKTTLIILSIITIGCKTTIEIKNEININRISKFDTSKKTK
jgi:hypothetical protein